MCVWRERAGAPLLGIAIVLVSLALLGGAAGLTVDRESGSGLPGETVTFDLFVTNDGAENDRAIISVNDTYGWNLTWPGNLSVGAGNTRNFTLEVEIPADALTTETDTVRVMASFEGSGENDTVEVVVGVEQVFDVEASFIMDINTTSAPPGRRAKLPLKVLNLGNGQDIVKITVIAPKGPAGEDTFEFLKQSVEMPVPARNYRSVYVELSLSARATPGESFDLTIYVNSSGGPTNELHATVTIEDHDVWIEHLNVTGERDGDVISDTIEAFARFGSNYQGRSDEDIALLMLSVRDPRNNGTVLATALRTIRLGDLVAGSATLSVRCTPAEFGEYTVEAMIVQDDVVWATKSMNITLVEPVYTFEVRCLENVLHADDEPVVFVIDVDNLGNVPDTYILEIISFWTFEAAFRNFTLRPKDEAHVNVTFIPADSAEGSIIAQVRVRSLTTSETQSVNIRVLVSEEEGAGEGFPVLILVAAAVAVMALVFFTRTEVGWLALLSLLPLYYRITGQRVLDNYIRGKIHGYIIANPGDHYNGIKEVLGINNGTLSYHLKVLEREKLVKSRMDGKYKRFYPYEAKIPRKRLTPIQKLIVDRLAENPGISQRKLAKIVGESVQVVNYHIRNLAAAGVVEVRKLGNRSQCYVSEEWK